MTNDEKLRFAKAVLVSYIEKMDTMDELIAFLDLSAAESKALMRERLTVLATHRSNIATKESEAASSLDSVADEVDPQ